ncbi:MAG TPA: MotA/TolQ/ExbB proton channel family protein [Candidatus Limnocylindrales bacterium]|nr:MotA/TolQ/ExbB proton channel family protein [Candidatus Limnocylindrales bacterium]
MIARLSILATAAVAVVLSTLPAGAADKPATLEELLERTRNARAEHEKVNAERERIFLASKQDQARMLAEAVRKRDEAEARSKALSARFDENERKLAEQEDLMNQRMGSLGELFGVVRQVAGDGANVMYTSLLSAQYPGRDKFFTELGKAKFLPSTEDLERLWFELQREMTESGRVVRFPATIVEASGNARQAQVVRIGSFVAMSEGRYLNYLPSLGQLAVLARQPSDDLTSLARDLQTAREGYVHAAVDPTRGVLLTMIVQRPDMMERIEKGEAVGYLIIAVGLIGVLAALYQTLYLVWTRLAVRRQLANLDQPRTDNPLGRVLRSVRTTPETIEEDAEVVELRISEAVLREVPRLERFQAFLRLTVAAGPLLGLIGTVIGMIITFQSITESGSSDPRLMANGIGQAMIATVLGLGIAIPLLFMNAGLASMSRGVVQILDEQSAGILAERLERAKARHRDG